MGAFLEGFADSLGGSIEKNYQRQQDDKQWEDRQKKLMELEKLRIASVQYAPGPDGRVMAQPVNAAGEPVGNPRPATEIEAKRFADGETERKRKDQLTQSQIDEANETRNLRKAQREQMPAELAIQQQQADSYRTTANARAVSSAANARESNARADLVSLEAQLAREGKPLPGRTSTAASGAKALTPNEEIKVVNETKAMMESADPPLTTQERMSIDRIVDPMEKWRRVQAVLNARGGTTSSIIAGNAQASSDNVLRSLEQAAAASRNSGR